MRPDPQYEQLQQRQDQFGDEGFTVVGFPCTQFLEQEPGSADEIAEFCSVNYGGAFPLAQKIDVNGDAQHPLFAELNQTADAEGHAGAWVTPLAASRQWRRPNQP